jgi:hypothetical protein
MNNDSILGQGLIPYERIENEKLDFAIDSINHETEKKNLINYAYCILYYSVNEIISFLEREINNMCDAAQQHEPENTTYIIKRPASLNIKYKYSSNIDIMEYMTSIIYKGMNKVYNIIFEQHDINDTSEKIQYKIEKMIITLKENEIKIGLIQNYVYSLKMAFDATAAAPPNRRS